MHGARIPTRFELAGRFGGFVFTADGRRRMLLRQGETEHLLKVPKELRRRIVGKFALGATIRVAGAEEENPVTGVVKHVVQVVLPDPTDDSLNRGSSLAPPSSPAPCVIKVCAKKNCWRNGGRELWDALDRERLEQGHISQIELRQVGCLDRCKHAPNADQGHQEYRRCAPNLAAAIIARATENLSSRERKH